MFENYLIVHCASTLAGIKTANLFSAPVSSEKNAEEITEKFNSKFQSKNIIMKLLKCNNNKALFYVYRPEKLSAELKSPENAEFLKLYGYVNMTDTDEYISRLATRLKDNDFPHEIGLFLGYPLADVKGFIKNKGADYAICGYWKVYENADRAKKIFAQFKKCERIYSDLYKKGVPLEALVA